MIDAERNSLRIDRHRRCPADARRDILDGDEPLREVNRLWGSRPDAALNSFWQPVEEQRVEGKEKAMIGAVRITKVDAVSENFAYQWAQKGCYNSFLRTGNSGCFPDGGVVAL